MLSRRKVTRLRDEPWLLARWQAAHADGMVEVGVHDGLAGQHDFEIFVDVSGLRRSAVAEGFIRASISYVTPQQAQQVANALAYRISGGRVDPRNTAAVQEAVAELMKLVKNVS